jgi:hypothetical protein
MADFQSVRSHFESNNLSFYSLYLKSEKLMKALIRHLPHYTLPEDMSDCLVNVGFDVLKVKEMTVTSRSPH